MPDKLDFLYVLREKKGLKSSKYMAKQNERPKNGHESKNEWLFNVNEGGGEAFHVA